MIARLVVDLAGFLVLAGMAGWYTIRTIRRHDQARLREDVKARLERTEAAAARRKADDDAAWVADYNEARRRAEGHR